MKQASHFTPVHAAAVSSAQASGLKEPVSILLVDDDANNLLALESILDFAEYRLVKAQTADAALLALMQEDYAAIVLDVQMPDLNGIELAKLIKQRKRTQHVPIIFLTAHYKESEDMVLGYDVGAVDYLTKPVHPAILRSKVSVFVDLFRKTRALAKLNNTMEVEISVRKIAEERFRIVVEAAPSAMIVYNADGDVVLVNSQAERLFGRSRSEFLGMPISELIEPEVLAECPIFDPQASTATEPQVKEIVVKRRDGSGAPVEISFTLIQSTQGPRTLASIVDITERKRSEEALRRANAELESKNVALQQQAEERLRRIRAEAAQAEAEAANAAKDRFLAMLSHELRTPLSPVLHMTTLLDEFPNCPVEVRQMIQVIRRNVQLESRLIDDLLDLARVRNGKLQLQMEATDAHEVLRRALDICEPDIEGRKLKVETQFNAERFVLQADPARLQQIFWNLISNAVKFTPEGGCITATTFNDGPALVVEFSDNGVGIEPQKMGRIFDAFEQVTQEGRTGLGLGLAICHALAEFHGGEITARSEGLGRGSTFVVRLPGAHAALPSSETKSAPQSDPKSVPLRLLVVEDHRDTAAALVRLLVRRGYEVKSAESVNAAVEVARAFHFDVLITDIGLPDGTGYDLFERLKVERQGEKLRGLALSGFGMDEDIARSTKAGFIDHLTKPVDFGHLQRRLLQIGEEICGGAERVA